MSLLTCSIELITNVIDINLLAMGTFFLESGIALT
jgi:hypothetical protein